MTDNELLTLADREAQRLTDENDHGAAIILRALADRLRGHGDDPAFDTRVAVSLQRNKKRGVL